MYLAFICAGETRKYVLLGFYGPLGGVETERDTWGSIVGGGEEMNWITATDGVKKTSGHPRETFWLGLGHIFSNKEK